MRALFGIFLLFAACGPDMGDDGVSPPPTGAVSLGLMADSGFVPLQDGGDLMLEAGAQGGFHVPLTARVDGFEQVDALEIRREIRRDDTGALVTRAEFTSSVGPDGRLDSVPVFLCPAPIGISVADEPLSVSLVVEANGGTAEASASFVPRCPDDDTGAFCDQICRR